MHLVAPAVVFKKLVDPDAVFVPVVGCCSGGRRFGWCGNLVPAVAAHQPPGGQREPEDCNDRCAERCPAEQDGGQTFCGADQTCGKHGDAVWRHTMSPTAMKSE